MSIELRRETHQRPPALLAGVVLGAFVALPTPAAAQERIRPGDLLLADGRFQEAATEYRTWLRAHNQDAAARNRLGLCLQKTGQAKQARREYERAVEADRCYAEAWNNLGTLDHVRGKYKRAVNAYRKAVECKPEAPEFHKNLGAAYLDMGNVGQSARAYAEALRLDPRILDAASALEVSSTSGGGAARRYFELAKACATRGELDAALVFLQRARVHGLPDFARAVSSEGAFADLLGDPRYAELLR